MKSWNLWNSFFFFENLPEPKKFFIKKWNYYRKGKVSTKGEIKLVIILQFVLLLGHRIGSNIVIIHNLKFLITVFLSPLPQNQGLPTTHYHPHQLFSHCHPIMATMTFTVTPKSYQKNRPFYERVATSRKVWWFTFSLSIPNRILSSGQLSQVTSR